MYLDSGWQTFINFFQLHLSYIVYCVVCLSFIYFYFFFGGGGVVLWLRICVEVAVDRISIQPPYFPVRFFVSSPPSYSLFNTSDSYLKSVRA